MPTFANVGAFDEPRSRLVAIGTDLSPSRAIVHGHGSVVAYARTGGMISPKRYPLEQGSTIYRFGGPTLLGTSREEAGGSRSASSSC